MAMGSGEDTPSSTTRAIFTIILFALLQLIADSSRSSYVHIVTDTVYAHINQPFISPSSLDVLVAFPVRATHDKKFSGHGRNS